MERDNVHDPMRKEMKDGMLHDPQRENVWTLGGKTMEEHTAHDTGDRKVKQDRKSGK